MMKGTGKLIAFPLAVFLVCAAVEWGFGGGEKYESIYDPLVGFQNMATLLVTDAFTPPAFFSGGEAAVGCGVTAYTVGTLLHDDSDDNGDGWNGSHVEGDGMRGYAYTVSGTYALSGRWAVFALTSQSVTGGKAVYTVPSGNPAYEGVFDVRRSRIVWNMAGVAFDCTRASPARTVSVPLFVAVKQQINHMDLDYTDTNGDVFVIKEHRMYYNLLVGIGVSFKAGKYVRITPYALAGIWNATQQDVYRLTPPAETYRNTIDEGTYLQGLDVSYRAESGLTWSAGIDGTYNEVNPVTRKLIHGLRMRTISLGVGYVF